MAKQLDKSEIESLNDLEKNFSTRVDEYMKQKQKEFEEGKRIELEEELKNLEDYLEGCRKSEIDDVRENIDFVGAKAVVLKEILGL